MNNGSRRGTLRVLLGVLTFVVLGTGARAGDIYSRGSRRTLRVGSLGMQGGYDYGTITQVPSGGITAASGGFYAQVNDNTPDGSTAGDSVGPYTHFGLKQADRSGTFSGSYTASIAIYLDPSWNVGSGFDYSVSGSTSSGSHLRDYIFHVTETSSGTLTVGASNNSSDASLNPRTRVGHPPSRRRAGTRSSRRSSMMPGLSAFK